MQNVQFRKWSSDEEQRLLNEVKENIPLSEIAKIHDRSRRAIDIRLADIAVKMSDTMTPDEVFEKTKMTTEQVNKRKEDQLKEKELKKKNDSITTDDRLTNILTMVKELQSSVAMIRTKIDAINDHLV